MYSPSTRPVVGSRFSAVLLLALAFTFFMPGYACRATQPFVTPNPIVDAVLLPTGIGALTAGLILTNLVPPPEQSEIDELSRHVIPAFDRPFVYAYSLELDRFSDFTQIGATLLPGVVFGLAILRHAADGGDIADAQFLQNILTAGILYVEAISLSLGIKDLLKSAVRRFRPFAYQPDIPRETLHDTDTVQSFPSGHTTAAFTGAALASCLSLSLFAEPWVCISISVGGLSLAAATAVLRVVSGNHFASDVLAGAALGILVGVSVPLLHT